MFSNKTLLGVVNTLKGRISKVLTWTKGLQDKEAFYLSELFNTLDDIILYDGPMSTAKVEYFKNNLRDCSVILNSEDKPSIKKHIIPMVNQMVEQEWKCHE